MVDDLLGADGISKEYLVILKQIEDYCSRGPEIDLDFQQSPNGNVLKIWIKLISLQLMSDTEFHIWWLAYGAHQMAVYRQAKLIYISSLFL